MRRLPCTILLTATALVTPAAALAQDDGVVPTPLEPPPPEPYPATDVAPPADGEVAAGDAEDVDDGGGASLGTTWSGHIEAAYHLNVGHTHTAPAAHVYDTFAPHGFVLHAAHVAMNHAFSDEVATTIELDFGFDPTVTTGGPLARFFLDDMGAPTFGPSSFGLDVQEAYVTYTSSFGLSARAGKFVTYEGIEVIEGPLNPTLTRGFLFGYAEPYTHTGAELRYVPEDELDLRVALVNGWDNPIDAEPGKTLLARVGYTSDLFSAGLSASFGAGAGDEDLMSFDLTGVVNVGDMLAIWVQGNYGAQKRASEVDDGGDAAWFGFGLQPVFTMDALTVGARFEWMNDKDDARMRTGVMRGVSYTNLTLTPGYTLGGGFTVRAEYRLDLASEDVLSGAEGSQHTIGVGAHGIF